MLASTRRNQARLLCSLTLAVVLVALLTAASALANPTVTVRVEGLTETKLPATQVTTTNTPVVKDGNSEHACSGTSAIGGLELATGGDWSGPWNGEFDQYEIYSIEGETHLFEPSSTANYYWSFWLDEKEATAGACEVQLQPGDRVLFFPACFGSSCPPEQTPLGIEAPEAANVGESIQVTVRRYSSDGTSLPLAGAEVNAGAVSGTTDSEGHLKLSIPAAIVVGWDTLTVPTYRHEALAAYQSGRPLTPEEQSALPLLMAKLERLGCSKQVVGLVVPTGYSFNLDGTNIYMTLATLFIAQALHVDLSWGQLLTILLVAMLTSKGASGVTGAGFVTLAGTLAAADARLIPGLAIIFGIDKFMSEVRALTNIIGNGVATIVVSIWEGELDRAKMDAALADIDAEEAIVAAELAPD